MTKTLENERKSKEIIVDLSIINVHLIELVISILLTDGHVNIEHALIRAPCNFINFFSRLAKHKRKISKRCKNLSIYYS